jgi:hypothetical protein
VGPEESAADADGALLRPSGVRRSGAVDAYGNRVADAKKRIAIRAWLIEIDCKWLRAVFTWASTWTLEGGGYLMRDNPVRGCEVEKEKNVRRPIATQDRYEALRTKSDTHTAFFGKSGTLEKRRSYLSELLDRVNGTGRRITAVCSLHLQEEVRRQRDGSRPHQAVARGRKGDCRQLPDALQG